MSRFRSSLLLSVPLVPAILMVPVPIPASSSQPQLRGKSGAGLARAIEAESRPSQLVADPVSVFPLTDGNPQRTALRDRFNDRWASIDDEAIAAINILPASWWERNTDIAIDLYNTLPGTQEVNSVKKNYPPGIVTVPAWDNGVWQVGTTSVSGIDAAFYSPPEKYKGDFARAVMYAATLYNTAWLVSIAFTILDGSDYPALTPYASRILLDWHRADPVDDIETGRNNAVEALQGNRNPFVDFPDLAEYLWGTHKGEPYAVEGEKTPLHSTYRLSAGEDIHLVSPEVPDDAVWTVNGTPVSAPTLSATTLGTGSHHLRFRSSSTGTSGYLMIKIVP